MNNPSPIAWLMIGFIIFFTLSLFLWLFSVKKNQQKNKNMNTHALNKMVNAIKDPFAAENESLDQLAEATKRLHEKIEKK